MMFGITWAIGRDAQRPRAQDLGGDYGKIRAVDAATEGDDG
jgi:hypothetical protein